MSTALLIDWDVSSSLLLNHPASNNLVRFVSNRFQWTDDTLLAASAEYCRRITRRLSRMAISALIFCFGITAPLQSYDEPTVSFIQISWFARLSLTGIMFAKLSAKKDFATEE